MKKILLFLVCTFICLSVYSQKIVNIEKCRSAYDEEYTKVTVFNSSYCRYIVCIVFAMDYWDVYNNKKMSTITITDTKFAPRANAFISIYKKPDGYKHCIRFYIKRVIFNDGKYINFN